MTCAFLLPLVVHAAFAKYPERAAEMAVLDHETCKGGRTAAAKGLPMSCAFVRQHLARSFYLQMYTLLDDHAAPPRIDDFECLLRFNHNYTEALLRRIERKITNPLDFENSQILITMKIADGRKAAHVKDLLLKHYSKFLSDYAHNKLANYVTDINYDSIKYNCTSAEKVDDSYHIYGRFVNSGLIVILAFFVHASIAVWLWQQVSNDDSYYGEWMLYLSRLVVQLPIATIGNALMVIQIVVLYDIGTHYGYVFLCLLLESIYGIHIGYVLCSFVKNYNSINLILYLELTIYVYASGLWWPTKDFSWWNVIINCMPVTGGISFARNVIEKQYFVINSLFILSCWIITLIMITVIDINFTKIRIFFI